MAGSNEKSLSEKANAVKQVDPAKEQILEQKKAEASGTLEDGEKVKTAAGKGDKILRVMAIIFLILFVGLIITLIVCIVTGSKYTLAVLFCLIIFPIILYIMAWLKKVFSS